MAPDGTKIVNQLTLKQGDYLGGADIIKSPEKWRRKAGESVWE